MATPPTRVVGVTPAVGWNSTASPKTSPTFDVQSGDLIVLTAFTENFGSAVATPTWTGTGTWTLQQSVSISGYCTAYLYTCPVTATATGVTISATRTGTSTDTWSFYASVWRNHGGLGVTGKTNVASGAPSLTLATAANSAVVCGNSDWNATSPTGHVWRTVNGTPMTETSQGGNAGVSYETYTGYAPDTGAAGSTIVGLTSPSQKYSIVGAEVLGTSSGTPATVTAVKATATTSNPAPTVTGLIAATVLAVAAACTSLAPAPAVTGAGTVVAVKATASSSSPAPSVQGLIAATVAAAPGTATAAAPAPVVTGQQAGTIQVSPATATANAPAPMVGAGGTGNVQAPTAAATASATAPIVTGQRQATIQAPTATATAQAPAPGVGNGATIQATTATAATTSHPPTVAAGIAVTIVTIPATATSTVQAPVITGLQAALTLSPTMQASAAAPAPTSSNLPLQDLTLTITPIPDHWAITPLPEHWAVAPIPNRWAITPLEATMATVITSAGAKKYVGGTITETTGADISTATIVIGLSTSTLTPPATSQTPDSDTPGATKNIRTVKLLVTNATAAAGTYWPWVKITGNPETDWLLIPEPVTIT